MRIKFKFHEQFNKTGSRLLDEGNFTTSNDFITFTDGSSYTPTVTPGSSDQVLGRLQLSADVTGASATGLSIQLNGSRIGLLNLKLWASADAVFGSDIQLGSALAARMVLSS